jgi:hypothetical protein
MKKTLVCSALFLAIGASHAQTYVGFDLGAALPDLDGIVSHNEAELRDDGVLNLSTSQDKTVPAFRIFGGMALNPNFDVELGYLYTGEARVTYRGENGGDSLRWTQDFSATGLDLAAVYKPFDNGFFVKGGVHATKGKAKTNAYENGVFEGSDSDSESGTGFLFGLGYQAPITKGINLRGSFVRYQRIAGESDYNLDLVTVGLTKQF